MISYGKLWLLLESKGLKKTDLLQVVSSPTLAKLSKNENINVSMIGKLCDFLDCQPGDIMENVSEKKLIAVAEQIDIMQKAMVTSLMEQGIDEEEFTTLMTEFMPGYLKQMFNEGNASQQLFQRVLDECKAKQNESINDEN